MNKRKVQSVIFCCDASNIKHFLLLQVNERRGLFWQNSTGGVEKNEHYLDAAKREAIEETGLDESNIQTIHESELEFSFTDQWKNNVIEKVFFIKCKKQWEITLDPSEHVQYKWISEAEFQSKTLKYKSNAESVLKCMEVL